MNIGLVSPIAGILIVAGIRLSAFELPKIEPVQLTPSAGLQGPPGSKEVSGIVASRQWPGGLLGY
jgi:hypothetical protein